MLKKVIGSMFCAVRDVLRNTYYKRLQKRLKNSDFTIICNNCFGGLVYHNLSQRFNSPTINLFIPPNDFLQFVANLKEYLEKELVEIKEHNNPYPIGTLTLEGYTVYIHFMHYASFEEAKAKWDERKKRIDYSNLYIIMMISKGLTNEYLKKFEALPYEHKLLIAHNNKFSSNNMVTHKVFTKKGYKDGMILNYKSKFSVRRHMDEIDYVSFLNKK